MLGSTANVKVIKQLLTEKRVDRLIVGKKIESGKITLNFSEILLGALIHSQKARFKHEIVFNFADFRTEFLQNTLFARSDSDPNTTQRTFFSVLRGITAFQRV